MIPSRVQIRNGARLPRGGGFLPGTSRVNICRMIGQSSPGKARDILVACCKRKEGKGIWSIARELMRPYSTVRGWLVRMMRRGLGGRFDWKSTGRKKILGQHILKKIMEWTRWDPSRYGFEPASWHLDMVNEMLRRETGRHAKPRTLRRILRRLGLSYSKPRPVPRKTAPASSTASTAYPCPDTPRIVLFTLSLNMFCSPAGIMRGTSPGYGWHQTKSRDEVRTGFSTIYVNPACGPDHILRLTCRLGYAGGIFKIFQRIKSQNS